MLDWQFKKVPWYRAHESVDLYLSPNERRPFLYVTPVLTQDISDYLEYERSSELGVSISLMRRNYASLRYPETLIKQSCWLIKNLCENTDLITLGIPVRLAVTTDLRDIALPYFERCNLPMSMVDWFESQEPRYWQSTKFTAMTQSGFSCVDKVLHLDVCYLIGNNPEQRRNQMFQYILEHWGDEPFAMTHPIFLTESEKELFGPGPLHKWDRMWEEDKWGDDGGFEGINPLWQEVSKFCGEPASQLRDDWLGNVPRHQVSGGMFGLSRQLLDDPSFIKSLYPLLLVGNEEVALSVYGYKQGWKIDDVTNLGVAIKWGDPKSFGRSNSEKLLCYTDRHTNWDVWLSAHKNEKRFALPYL